MGRARNLRTLTSTVFIRSGDAIHLVSARSAGLSHIGTSDRHLLEGDRHLRLSGRGVWLRWADMTAPK